MSHSKDYSPFRERLRNALRSRLHPHSNLHVKQLAYALQLSEQTIWNLLAANNEPSGRTVDKLVGFFRDQFIQEIWGCHNIVCFDRGDAARSKLIRQREEIEAELQRMESR